MIGTLLLSLIPSGPPSPDPQPPRSLAPGEPAIEIIERRCLPCHGGDRRESGLSFADRDTFRLGGARGSVIHDGDLGASRLLDVVRYGNPDLAMPPSGVLPADEIAVLEAWVFDGAVWPDGEAGRLADPARHPLESSHVSVDEPWWAYGSLEEPAVPGDGGGHVVDAFIDAGRDARGIAGAPQATPAALLRRASFDLTGLPPSEATRAAYFATLDAEGFEAAWSELLDGLFASPHYGEHQARHWLDLVRYGETNGYERDNPKKNVWRYRDWVVRAFQSDMPYDRFVALQWAGDEYAREIEDRFERDSARLATGFFRLGVWDDEPVDRPQAAADGRADVIDTFSQVVMATTMGCARCHDHKADPVTQAEYYSLTAHVAGMVHYRGAPEADLLDPLEAGVRTIEERDADVDALDVRLAEASRSLDLGIPGAVGAEAVTLVGDARSGGATWRYRFGDPLDGWHMPGFDHADWREGPSGFGRRGTPESRVGTEWHTKFIQLRTTFRLTEIPSALRLFLHHDDHVKVYLNGVEVLQRGGYRVSYGDYQLDQTALDALVVGRNVLAVECEQDFGGQYIDVGLDTGFDPAAIGGVVEGLERLVRERADDPDLEAVGAMLVRRKALLDEPVNRPYPAQIVREHGHAPPIQHINLRGSVHALGEVTPPTIPAAWSKGSAPGRAAYTAPDRGPEGAPTSGRRRALVEWVFDGGAHLAARVEANRTWQFLFGRGLCRSAGDFGRLGEAPTHPELLDHLALELQRRNWSRKSLQRYLMESATYKMATVGPDASLAADPRNDGYWRFDPRRLTAEEYRDAALAASGELNPKRFGPSVYPPLPEEVLATASRPGAAWGQSTPEDAVRRSLYVHVKRSLREPLLAVLDQPDPDLPCPERFPTNVPTQALLTLNGDFTRARAHALAASLTGEGLSLSAAIAEATRRTLGRDASADELARAERLVEALRAEHGQDPEGALALFALGLLNLNEFSWLD